MKLAKKKLERKQTSKTSSLRADVSPRGKAKSPSKKPCILLLRMGRVYRNTVEMVIKVR